MTSKLLTVAGALTAAVLTGCINVATFDYSAAPGAMIKLQEAGGATKTVAVMPFMDQRGAKYFAPNQHGNPDHPHGDSGSFYLGFIPLWPLGYVEKEEPENSEDFVSLGRFHFNLQNDLANAAIMSLKTSNLFASVVRANNIAQANTDYIWRGRVTNTYYNGHMYAYCITYFLSPALWIIGFPSGRSVNEFAVSFDLIERASGKVVWTYDYSGRDYIVHWLYARIGQDASLYAQLMKQAMNGALYDLAQKLPEIAK